MQTVVLNQRATSWDLVCGCQDELPNQCGQLLTQQPLSSQINPALETPDKPMQITDEPLII